jgi:hypothetical protein
MCSAHQEVCVYSVGKSQQRREVPFTWLYSCVVRGLVSWNKTQLARALEQLTLLIDSLKH